VSPKSQLLTLTRYLFTWGLSGLLLLRQQRTPAAGSTAGPSARKGAARHDNRGSRRLLVLLLLGGIDVSCYSLYNLGFSLAGAALATVTLAAAGQIATAVLSATVLRRQLRRGHIAAVAVVTLGLMVRSMDDVVGRSGSGSSSSSTTATTTGSREPLYGVLCITVSALLFSILGCAYESLMAPDAARPPGSTHATQAQVRRPAWPAAQRGHVPTRCTWCALLAHCPHPRAARADVLCGHWRQPGRRAGAHAAVRAAALAGARGGAAGRVRADCR
jgi:drug/metabolite transporter (DMT)-like permease